MALHDISKVAKRFGVDSLLTDSYLRLETHDLIIESVIISGFATTPASQYHDGVDVAIIKYSSDKLNLPYGYYNLTTGAINQITSTGQHIANSSCVMTVVT